MDKNIASRRHALSAGNGVIVIVGIRDVYGLVEPAVSIAEIQNIRALGRLMISLPGLGPDGIPSEGDLVGFNNLASGEEFEGPLFLQHHHVIGM